MMWPEENSVVFRFNFVSLCLQEKTNEQKNWRVIQDEKLTRLREKLQRDKERLARGFFSFYSHTKYAVEKNMIFFDVL